MAELNYNDVQRAVRESLQNLTATVGQLSSNIGAVSNRSSHINDIELVVRDLQRTVQLMQTNLNTMRQTKTGDLRIQQISRDINELKIRFSAIEKFALQMSEYIRARELLDSEDRQYRNA